MDDLTVTTFTVPGSRCILQRLERLIKWAQMSLKPAKYSSRGIQKFIKELETWISRVDMIGLPGKFKSWIY